MNEWGIDSIRILPLYEHNNAEEMGRQDSCDEAMQNKVITNKERIIELFEEGFFDYGDLRDK